LYLSSHGKWRTKLAQEKNVFWCFVVVLPLECDDGFIVDVACSILSTLLIFRFFLVFLSLVLCSFSGERLCGGFVSAVVCVNTFAFTVHKAMDSASSAPSYGNMDRALDGRSVFLRTQMRLRESEYIDNHDLVLFVGTWNVNGKPPKEALGPWLLQTNGATPDVVALGLQEFDTSTSALILSETSKAEPWIAAMGATLNRLPETQVKKTERREIFFFFFFFFLILLLNPLSFILHSSFFFSMF
jgi:hypothetical protein